MKADYFDRLLEKESIFKDESKLDINFVPDKLPHREKELSLLSQLFLNLLKNPNKVSRKVLVTGKTGIGKTATLKLFGDIIKDAASKREVEIDYVHINCRKEKTSYKLLIKLIRKLDKSFPKRGYSSQDILDIIQEYLIKKDLHLIIILDELNYLIRADEDILYSLTRFMEDANSKKQFISIIGIVRDLSVLAEIDKSTMSTLQRNIIKFDLYSKSQIFDILKYRTDLSLKENIISEEILRVIAEMSSKKGDIRYALNLIWRAAKIAEAKEIKEIKIECIRLANQDLMPFATKDILRGMKKQKLVLLLSVSSILQRKELNEVSINEIVQEYVLRCENLNLTIKSRSQLWNYLQELKTSGIITARVKSRNIRGRRSLIGIPDIPLERLQRLLKKYLENGELDI
ncbi:MAG: ORC1-type DNA replication protein [Promethearchaeia archaeon]